MLKLNKSCLSWLLILALAITPLQASMAVDFSTASDIKCPMMENAGTMAAPMDARFMQDNCESCNTMPCSVSTLNLTTIQSDSPNLLVRLYLPLMNVQPSNDPLFTLYPDLIIRPPIS